MGRLIVIPTPLGNLEDITIRALKRLGEVDALACEDTRRTRILFEKYQAPSPKDIIAYHEHNEAHGGKRILALLDIGKTVGLTSDSGTPGISDPGYRIITEALAKGHELEVLPGPTAAVTALLMSGLPTSSFLFRGFPPRKAGQLLRFLEQDKDLPHTLIYYESPFRLSAFLDAALMILGDRRAAVCVEMTKIYERVHRDKLSSVSEIMKTESPRGEVTVVIEGLTRAIKSRRLIEKGKG